MSKASQAALSLTLLLTFLFQGSAEAQIFKNKLKRENQELRARVDSLKKALTELKEASQHKDSIADEMIGVYEENTVRTAAGLSPEDYTQEGDGQSAEHLVPAQAGEAKRGRNGLCDGFRPIHFQRTRQ